MNEQKPEEALRLYRARSRDTLNQLRTRIQSPSWSNFAISNQAKVLLNPLRIYADPLLSNSTMDGIIEDITSSLDRPALALYLLQNDLRTLFSPTQHPMLNPATSRALSKPAGGKDAHSDFHDSEIQRFKRQEGWGCYNVLGWCCSQLSSEEVERYIGVILPPTLVLMDDWEPPWRERGVKVMATWVEKLDVEIMRRMGMSKLLTNSMIHTMSLHANPPLPDVLPILLRLLERTTKGKEKAERYSEIMDKAVVQGWMYAPSGIEGRVVLVDIAATVEKMCDVVGTGIIRWLKTIIPNLLDPLQYPPTPTTVHHYQANLSCLLCVMRTVKDTGRIARWRGQIMDILARLWVNMQERGDSGESDPVGALRQPILDVMQELEGQCPLVREVEYKALLELDKEIFQSLVPAAA